MPVDQGVLFTHDSMPVERTITLKNNRLVTFWISACDLDLAYNLALDVGYLRHRHNNEFLHIAIAKRMFGEIQHGYEVDHIDRNRLNDLRSNLRLATKRGQLLNSTHPFKGYERHGRGWRAFGWLSGHGRIVLGTFADEQAAQQCALTHRASRIAEAERDGTYIYPNVG